jgi:transketolase
LQITGSTADVCNTDPLDQKFESFGWAVQQVDGHDIAALKKIFSRLPFEKDKPSVIIANTIKGKGISFMENDVKWHHGVPDKAQYAMAMDELNTLLRKQALTEQ